MARITVATLNILHNVDHWPLRYPLIARELAELQPDVIGLQECLLRTRHAKQITDQLNFLIGKEEYHFYEARRTGWLTRIEGIAVISKLRAIEEDRLPLRSGNRIAQRVRFVLSDGKTLDLVNSHFHHPIDAGETRAKQAQRMIRWLASRNDPDATVIVGDLNGQPEEPAVRLLKKHFGSVFETIGLPEPHTYGTPFAELFEQPAPQKTIDYILVSPNVVVESARRVFEKSHPEFPEIYPSDHYGLYAAGFIP